MKKSLFTLKLVCMNLLLVGTMLSIIGQNEEHPTNELIISFINTEENEITAESTGCFFVGNVKGVDAEVWCLPESETITINGTTISGLDNIVKHFQSDNYKDIVSYVEPNSRVELIQEDPNDPLFPEQYGLRKVNGVDASNNSEQGNEVVVGVIDSGIEWNSPDLADNIWQNLGEDIDGDGVVLEWTGTQWIFDPGDENGIDDDGNGYVDDFIGWDFYNNDNTPEDNCSHGTHVAGIIGASGNNGIGITGVSNNAKLMAVKIFHYEPTINRCDGATTAEIAAAVDYVVSNGVKISNNSWGGSVYRETLRLSILSAEQANHLFVAAAGNSSSDMEITPFYPAAYDAPNIISVASTNENDELSWFSNYGSTTVDLAAPGSGILSTVLNGDYADKSGTSMAAPHVTGAAAIMAGICENFDYAHVKNKIMESVDEVSSLAATSITGGRLNIGNAVNSIENDCDVNDSCIKQDSLALVALYNSANGAAWFVPWDLSQPVDTWHGITLSTDKCNVTQINLSNNGLVGTIPSELGNLQNLVVLTLGNNGLTGSIPAELGNLTNLEELFLFDNDLSGCYPQAWCGLSFSNLDQFDCGNNAALPGGGSDQGFIDFCNGEIAGCEPRPCLESDSLALVALYNATNGPNWTTTWDLTQPVNTWFGVTMNDECSVKKLYLRSNNLVGVIPAEIGNLSKLVSLTLRNDLLSGNIPAEIGNLSNLTYLNLCKNQLSGNIPSELGGLTMLTHLFLYTNNLTGAIPAEIGDLSNLEDLRLGYNELEGNIPSELGNLTSLTNLNIRNNNLTGNLPPQLGNLINLESLHLDDNSLTGSLPAQWGNLVSLNYFNISTNNLSGVIPSEFGELTMLTHLFLYDNDLEGFYPPQWCNFAFEVFNCYNNFDLPDNGSYEGLDGFCFNVGGGDDIRSGDMNRDGIVDFYDFLSWGMNYGKTGPPSINGQVAADWDYTNLNGINAKYSDADGNGIVNEVDVDVIDQNYGEIYGGEVSILTYSTIGEIYNQENIELSSETYNSNEIDTLVIDVILEPSIENMYGAAWQIDLSGIDLQGVKFVYKDGWFGAENEAKSYYHYNPDNHTIDIAVTRINSMNLTNSTNAIDNIIGYLKIEEDNVGSWSEDEVFGIVINDALLTDTNGDYFNIANTHRIGSIGGDGPNLEVVAIPGLVERDINFNISLSNPQEHLAIDIFDESGRMIMQYVEKELDSSNSFTYDFSKLPTGTYFYQVRSNWNKKVGRFIKVK